MTEHERLSGEIRARLLAADRLWASAVSIYEIDYKRRTRKLPPDDLLLRMPDDMHVALPRLGFELLDISAEAAWIAANLRIPHRDPWDRLLLAQARVLGVPLVSSDAAMREHSAGVDVIW